MRFFPVLFVVAAGFLTALSGCAATERSNETEAAGAQLVSPSDAVLKGKVAAGGSLAVAYEPSEFPENYPLPYIAVALLPNAENETARTVTVSGDFPGQPHVLVVDTATHAVVAETNALRSADGASATLSFAPSAAPRSVLIRDELWVRPMTIKVDVQ